MITITAEQAQQIEETIHMAYCGFPPTSIPYKQALSTIRAARAQEQAEQEPVALESVYETIIQWDECGGKRSRRELARRIVALYAAPVRTKDLTVTPENGELERLHGYID